MDTRLIELTKKSSYTRRLFESFPLEVETIVKEKDDRTHKLNFFYDPE